ncbi:MAG: hypothetical protein SLAVMIC_00002 [uncultured marine phage]|uniref:Uncharacterized protein n=1 Tax=uncultured marine phage TaxID=707152 RepID=A0A8D9CCA7_9VIRU|nr:MAG: hypothetical protein SLAVMIC_00002 [uncultured marine phage]
MTKIDKKIKKQKERIAQLEEELRTSLTKKDSSTSEISVPQMQRKIASAKLILEHLELTK